MKYNSPVSTAKSAAITAMFVNDISTAVCSADASSKPNGTSTRSFNDARQFFSNSIDATAPAKTASESPGVYPQNKKSPSSTSAPAARHVGSKRSPSARTRGFGRTGMMGSAGMTGGFIEGGNVVSMRL